MSFKWVVPAALVSCGVIFYTVIAQLAPLAVPPPAVETSETVDSALAPEPQPAAKPVPAGPTVAPPSSFNSASAPEPQPIAKRRSGFLGGESQPPAREPEMVVLRLRNTDAPTVSEMLRNLLANDELEAVRPTVDPRSNSLILRGPKDDVDRVRKLVEQLDSESEAKVGIDLPKPARIAVPRVRSSSGPNAAWPAANAPYVSAPRNLTTADVKLMQDYASLENQSLEAAKAYRKGTESLGESHPQQKERREQIGTLVEKSFDVRQELQNQELKQLQERMAKVEQSLGKRAQNRSEIIGKRIKELLEEDRDLEWNASIARAISTGYATAQSMIPRTVPGPDGIPVTVYEVDPRTTPARITQVPVVPNYSGSPTVTNSPAGVSAQNIPPIAMPIPWIAAGTPTSAFVEPKHTVAQRAAADPFAPVESASRGFSSSPVAQPAAADPYAQPAGAEQRRALGNANELWLRKEAEVAVWKKKLKEADLQENAEYQTALRDLQAAKRQLDSAKRESEALLKLLQLDLDAANTEYEAAREELSIHETRVNSGTEGIESLPKLRAAVRQAEVRIERAKTLLDLHRAATEPSNNPNTPKQSTPTLPGSTGNPAPTLNQPARR